MTYLEKPTSMVHVNSSRFLACLILVMKFVVGLLSETLLILTLSAYPLEGESDLQSVLLQFVIFVLIYEVPTLFFKLKQGSNQSKYAEYMQSYNEIRKQDQWIDKQYGVHREGQRAEDVDCGISFILMILDEIYRVFFAYSYFYLIFLIQINSWKTEE